MTRLIKKFHKHLGYGVKMFYLLEPTDDYSGIAISSGDEEAIDKIVLARNAHDELVAALGYARRFLNEQDHDMKFVDAALAKAGVV